MANLTDNIRQVVIDKATYVLNSIGFSKEEIAVRIEEFYKKIEAAKFERGDKAIYKGKVVTIWHWNINRGSTMTYKISGDIEVKELELSPLIEDNETI